jgi:ABC-type transporter Mla subunit MlaD
VGILFVAIMLLAIGVGLFLSNAGARWGTYHITLHFKDTKGLQTGADVLLSGVSIGKVAAVDLAPDPRFPELPVVVTLSLRRKVKLFNSDQFVIDQGALLGDRYVSVLRPSREQLTEAGQARGSELPPNSNLAGGPAQGFADLSGQATQFMGQAQASMNMLTGTYANEEIRKSIMVFMANASRASGQLEAITKGTARLLASLNRMVDLNQTVVNRSMGNVEVATKEIKVAAEQINGMIKSVSTGPLPAQLLITVANIRKSSDEMRASAELIRGMLANPTTQKRIDETVGNVCDITASLRSVTASLEKMATDPTVSNNLKETLANLQVTTENLKQISITSREFITDKQNLENLRQTLDNLRQASAEGITLTRKATGTLQRVDDTMNELGNITETASPRRTTTRLRMEVSNEHALRGDVDIDLNWATDPRNFWRVGVRGVGRGSALDLQRGLALGSRSLVRAGLIGGKLGAGLEYEIGSGTRVELEAWNPDENRLDLRSYFGLGGGWELTAGVDRLLHENDPFIGVQRVIYSERTK